MKYNTTCDYFRQQTQVEQWKTPIRTNMETRIVNTCWWYPIAAHAWNNNEYFLGLLGRGYFSGI